MSNLSEIKEIYKQLTTDKPILWIVRIILSSLTVVTIIAFIFFIIDGYKGRHAKLLYGLFEINIPQDHSDTLLVYIPKHDTITVFKTIYKESPEKKRANIRQENLTGDNNYVGGDNNGIVGGTNNKIIKERTLTEGEQQQLINYVKHFQKVNNLKPCVNIVAGTGASGRILEQIKSLLASNGFNLEGSFITTSSFVGVSVDKSPFIKDCLDVLVGTIE